MRAWLFVPGHDARKLRKALALEGVRVVVDWEDGVPAEAKGLARTNTEETLNAFPGTQVYLRLNSLGTPMGQEDLEWLAAHRHLPLAGLVLAKAEEPALLWQVGEAFPWALIPLVETARGLVRSVQLAEAHPRVERLALGYLDLLANLRAHWASQGGMLAWVRAQLVVASRAAGKKGPVDGVYPWLDDPQGLEADAREARSMGFSGKFVVHPAHIPVVERAFAPGEEEEEFLRMVEEALEEARRQGQGAVRLPDGRFADPAVLAWAKGLVEEGE